VVDEGRGKWVHVCRSGSRIGACVNMWDSWYTRAEAGGCVWAAMVDESRGRWAHVWTRVGEGGHKCATVVRGRQMW
jgi:hypothetical protein